MNILVGVTGSVAAIKTQELVNALKNQIPNACIRVIVTFTARKFLKDAVEGVDCVYADDADWSDEAHSWTQRGDPVLHIELRKWADVLLIVPLSAHTLAKIANGLCDTLLTCVCRAWDFQKPLLVAPAMNTLMWLHPLTGKHLKILTHDLKATIIAPEESKTLACGDVGVGAMRSVAEIAKFAAAAAASASTRCNS